MKRRLLANILFAVIIFPHLLIVRWWNNIFTASYDYYSTHYGNLIEFMKSILWNKSYFILPFISLLSIQLPYNLILLRYKEKGKILPLWKKILIMLIITFVSATLLGLIPGYLLPAYGMVDLFLVFLAVFYVLFHYWLVDKYDEKDNRCQTTETIP
ncbi:MULTISPECIES: hypothetical protein [Chitinophagaceae]